MDPQTAIDASREAIQVCLVVGGPILAASLILGLLISLLQAMTQLHDQTISFVPKLLGLLVLIAVCLPWLTDRMVEFSRESLSRPNLGAFPAYRSPAQLPVAAAGDRMARRETPTPPRAAEPPEREGPATGSPAPFQLPHYQRQRRAPVPKEG